jgi:hypothetical protein
VLFIGTQPGSVCYGESTSDPAAAGPGMCYDPTSPYKGNHGYPYRGFVWAYDANDLAAVKQGKRNPWDIKPYAAWTITAPFMSNASDAILGAAYDPATQRVFMSLGHADGSAPVIAVYQLAVEPPDTGDTPPAIEPPATSPPAVVAASPTATISAATCKVTSIKAKMPAGGGWTAEFFDGDKSLGKDAGGPATRPAQTVSGGEHSITVRWTKAGHDPIVTSPLVLECQ